MVPVEPRVQVALAGLSLAGVQVATQTVPTAVFVQLAGQVARVAAGGAVVHTAGVMGGTATTRQPAAGV